MTEDGKEIYIRYRYGKFRAHYDGPYGDLIHYEDLSNERGDLDGVMSTEEALQKAGMTYEDEVDEEIWLEYDS